jgi:hypothetical protein
MVVLRRVVPQVNQESETFQTMIMCVEGFNPVCCLHSRVVICLNLGPALFVLFLWIQTSTGRTFAASKTNTTIAGGAETEKYCHESRGIPN